MVRRAITHRPAISASDPYKERRDEEEEEGDDDDVIVELLTPPPLDDAVAGDDDDDIGAMAHNSLISSVMCIIIFRSFKNHTSDGLKQLAEKARITSLATEAM